MNTPSLCPACGNLLKPEDRFCPACGRPATITAGSPPPVPVVTPPSLVPPPLNITPAPPPVMPSVAGVPPVATSSEQVISVIGMVRKKTGLFSSELYHMAITNQRLIFALQTKEMQNQDVKNARDQAKQQGKGFLGQVGAQMATRYGDKYVGMPPHLILVENPQNFAISINDVVKISTFTGDSEDNTPDTMEIKTTTQKMKFIISNAYSVEKQLKAVLGSKVH